MELFEWLFAGSVGWRLIKSLKRFYAWASWLAERKKEWRERRWGGVKLCAPERGKIDRFFYGAGRVGVAWGRREWVRFLKLKKELRAWRRGSGKPCGSGECDHWEFSKTKDGGRVLQHNALEVWESIREMDFYMKRYELFRMPIPEKVMGR